MLCFLTIALVAGRNAAESLPFAMLDLIRGSGKTMAAKYGGQLIVRATRIICGPPTSGTSFGLPLAMDTLDPAFVGEPANGEAGKGAAALLENVKGSDLTDSIVLPHDMGELMQRAKVGAQRLYILPGNSPIAAEIVNACGAQMVGSHPPSPSITPSAAPSLLLVSLQVADAAKLKDRKEKKEGRGGRHGSKRSQATDAAVSPSAAATSVATPTSAPSTPITSLATSTAPSASATPAAAVTAAPTTPMALPSTFDSPLVAPAAPGNGGLFLPTLSETTTSVSSSSSSIVDDDALAAAAEAQAADEDAKERADLARAVDELMGALRAANDNVNAMPVTQNKIIKFLLVIPL
jgi:hypothetical protein